MLKSKNCKRWSSNLASPSALFSQCSVGNFTTYVDENFKRTASSTGTPKVTTSMEECFQLCKHVVKGYFNFTQSLQIAFASSQGARRWTLGRQTSSASLWIPCMKAMPMASKMTLNWQIRSVRKTLSIIPRSLIHHVSEASQLYAVMQTFAGDDLCKKRTMIWGYHRVKTNDDKIEEGVASVAECCKHCLADEGIVAWLSHFLISPLLFRMPSIWLQLAL